MQRHSSRRARLDQSVLTQRLIGAVSYDRIAGYFRSSVMPLLSQNVFQTNTPEPKS